MFSAPIEFRRNDIEEYTYRPYGTKDMGRVFVIYKHIVPTKSTPNARVAFVGTKERYSVFNKLKLMRKIRLGNRTWVFTFSKSQEQKTLKTE